jgi:hypothetical protein
MEQDQSPPLDASSHIDALSKEIWASQEPEFQPKDLHKILQATPSPPGTTRAVAMCVGEQRLLKPAPQRVTDESEATLTVLLTAVDEQKKMQQAARSGGSDPLEQQQARSGGSDPLEEAQARSGGSDPLEPSALRRELVACFPVVPPSR